MQLGTKVFIKSMKKNGVVVECGQFPHGKVPSNWPLVKIENYDHPFRTAEFFDPADLEVQADVEVVEQVMEVRFHVTSNHSHMVWIKLRDDRDSNNLLWAISDSEAGRSLCLNRNLEWESEPMPSNRTDEWRKRCRFSLEEAKELVYKYFRSINGT